MPWLAALCLLVVSAAAQSVQRVALVIGNAAYQHETTLKNPLRDAELIARTLKDDLRFDVVQRVSNGKRVDLVREIAKFRAAAAGAEVAVVYYSGHGMMNSRRQNFLLPVDMPNSSADASADGDVELDANAISEDALIAAVDGAGVQVVVLDACRTNAIVRRGDKNSDKGLSRRADQSRKRLIVYATEEGRVAEDGAGANSTFADSLARNLMQTSWPVMKVMTEVANEVERGTKGKQSPTWSGNLRVDVYLVNPTITVNSNAGASGVQGATTSRSDPDEEAWKAAQGADTVEGYEQYLSDFRTGRYISAAMIKLAAAKRRDSERTAAANLAAERLALPSTSVSALAGSALDLQDGDVFRDCEQPYCPEMVVVPSGKFSMGSRDSDSEKPPHRVSIRTFALGKFEVTQAQWKAVMGNNPSHFSACGEGCPVDSVSWDDVQQFLRKLNRLTGKQYRLPSEAEWEYAASTAKYTNFSWGDDIGRNNANCDGCGSRWDNLSTAPVGSFRANTFGLHDMHGNVWEWVQDAWHGNYDGAPTDGSAWVSGGDQTRRVLRGGSWSSHPRGLRVAFRFTDMASNRYALNGFRLARTIGP